MIKVAVVGLGKMGISHLGIIRPHKDVELAAVCDSTGYILDILSKYTGLKTYTSYDKMLEEAELDAVIIATPSKAHVPMVKAALERGIHVFCEKPFTLSAEDSQMLAELAASKGLVNQVGYHYRFVGAFQEVKRLLDAGAIGEVSHVMAEAYGPVVLKPKGSTWRTQRVEGGGCLYDYAAHPINLLNWYFGMPSAVGGSVLGKIFSSDTDDEVYGTLYFDDGKTAQVSVNWSDESYRKMSTKITVWGTKGRIYADRQEVQVYLRDDATPPEGYTDGWNVRYTTELTEEVDFYIRGEEYSAQLDYFVRSIIDKNMDNVNGFTSAAQTDGVIAMMIADAEAGPADATESLAQRTAPKRKRFSLFSR
ncbi:gfo/Idh/MocA family oxidoreductase [Altererythrobacter xixiisoli]|uniref:Gfo/Idh/MocA family oxidoreductase n=1 Tax=Croceibacterium xixiisoli TaxID=1476466 RepID=A0A6I4TWX2_9SPHN|nr:Gfo/Idh/MocA family oxidoreductase [Croceibacterium xixiisoli]MXO99138.1 gfo/Idh/MocA family oxidoreductase [Croceibacterium xixiisoli]